jgi:hypothetical protein
MRLSRITLPPINSLKPGGRATVGEPVEPSRGHFDQLAKKRIIKKINY